LVTDIRDQEITVRSGETTETIPVATVLWAAGVQSSPLGKVLAEKSGARLDKAGRVQVNPDLSLPGYPEIFVIGDLAALTDEQGKPLPGVAPVAMQEGEFVAKAIDDRLKNVLLRPFHYHNKGNLAVIGRNAAVADLGRWRLSGFFAWFLWVFVHIRYLIEFDNKVMVLFQWAWNYFTRRRGARLITGEGTK
jgi:NADH dehydrogenase